jgi:protein disulfide-isomerase A1
MVKQSLPAVSTVTPEGAEEFKTLDKVVVVAYIASDDKATNETFTQVAEELRDEYLFGGSNDAALAKTEGVEQPAIVLYKDFDEKKAVFKGKLDADSLREFIKTASTPLVGVVGPDTYAGYMSVCFETFFFLSTRHKFSC